MIRQLLVVMPALAWLLLSGQQLHGAPRPNLLVVVADELGYGDLGCYRGNVATPHLDSLAASGTKALRYYSAASVSTPVRASLLSGWYPERFGIVGNFREAGQHLRTNAMSLPRLLQQAGYATAHVGRWNLGGFSRAASVPGPREQGFQHWLGREEIPHQPDSRAWLRDGEPRKTAPVSLLEVQLAESLRLLDEFADGSTPFFLNLWLDAPRDEDEGIPEEFLKLHRESAAGEVLRHRAIVSQMDSLMGRLLTHLHQRGLETNTVIVFTSATGAGPGGSARGFRGEAGTLLEGGLRVPFLIRWPGVIKAGRSVGPVLHTTDLLPTLCAAAGISLAPELVTDGVNFLPYFQGAGPAPLREVTAWRMQPVAGVYERHGFQPPLPDEAVVFERWKVLFAAGQPVAVFNLFTDSGERFNRLDDPKEAKALEKVPPLLERWRAHVREPVPVTR